MDERRGRAITYLIGSVVASIGVAAGFAWWAGIAVFGALCVVGSMIPNRGAER